MKTHIVILGIGATIAFNSLLFSSSVIFAQPVLTDQRCLGSTANDEFRSICLKDDGGCIVAGFSTAANGDVSSKMGSGDYWILKLDKNFMIRWQNVFGGSARDWARDIKPTADGGYVVFGYSKSTNGGVTQNHGGFDYWLVKIDFNGLMEWQKAMGGSKEDNGYTVEPTPDGGYICSGYSFSSDGDVTNNHGLDDGWVVKLDASHNIQWQHSFGGSLSDQIDDVILTSDGGYLLVGYAGSADGDVTSNHGNLDMWLIKIDSNGSLQWQKTYGGQKDDAGREGIQTSDGGFIIAGFSSSKNGDATTNKGGSDLWVIKIDGTGALKWQHSFGSLKDDYAYTIGASSDGNFLVSGFSGSNDGDAIGNHGNSDAWLLKIDTGGNLLWQMNLGGSLEDVARSCGEQKDGSILVAGFTKSNDGDVYGQHGDYDGWVVRVSPAFGPYDGRLAQDSWAQRADFGGTARYGARGFPIGDKEYMGTGFDGSEKKDSTSSAVSVYTSCKEEDMLSEQQIFMQLYPNPTNSTFILELKSNSIIDEALDLYVLNALGQIVYTSHELTANGELKKVITMPSTASPGWYVIRVMMNDQVMEKKLMYQK